MMNFNDNIDRAKGGAESKILYRNWYIVPFAVPQADGTWCATCEIEVIDADGWESFQGTLENVVHEKKEEAIALSCENARKHIDDIVANPLG